MIAFDQHPDADRLAAYSEGALDQREQNALLAHLAHCRECRDCLRFLVETQPAQGARQPLRYSRLVWVAAACLLLTFVWRQGASPRVAHYPGSPQAAAISTRKPYAFRHVQLSRSALAAPVGRFAMHFAHLKPDENQIVVNSVYGERWLTFDSILTIANPYESAGTVN